MQQAAHTANDGAADGADAVMAERSTAPVQHPVSHTLDEVEMSIGPSPADDDQRSRVYIMISKKGNQTQYEGWCRRGWVKTLRLADFRRENGWHGRA